MIVRRIRALPPFILAIAVILVFAACNPDREEIQAPETQTGACCNLDTGACSVLTQDECAGQTRTYQGDGTVCSPNPCSAPPASGACCNAETGACEVLTAAECQARPYGHTFEQGASCSPNPCPAPHSDSDYAASLQIGTLESGEVKTATGAALNVGLYTVPSAPGGAEGQMVFSIERDQETDPTLPSGVTKVSEIYRFGPEEFIFARPVRLTLPITGTIPENRQLTLYRVNQTTGQCEAMGGTIDATERTITTDTYKLSPWFIGDSERPNTAWGAFHVTNHFPDSWVNLCVTSVQLKYPSADADFNNEIVTSTWAPPGEIGWNSEGNWYLPQGTYTICAEVTPRGTVTRPPGAPSYKVLTSLRIDSPWSASDPVTVPLGVAPGDGWQSGACDCTPTPTPPVGTGQIQVTLTWHSAQGVDLDLWVTDPAGERCYYANETTASGGVLDIDNKCSNYVNGRPENIFWNNSAPTGEYKVEVDWFSGCSSGLTSLPYDVRVVNGSTVRTYTVTGRADSTQTVCRFTVTGAAPLGTPGAVSFSEPVGTSRARTQMPRKD